MNTPKLTQIHLLAGFIAAVFLSSAGASETLSSPVTATADAVSHATPESMGVPSLFDSLYLSYFATFHGANLKDLSSTHTVDRNGVSSKGGINFDSELTAAYMLNSNIGIGPVLPFLLVPVLGQGFIMGDAGLKVFNKKTLSTHGLDVYTNLILQAPTSQSSKDRNMSFAVKTTPFIRYSFPSSRLAVGAWTEAKAYLGPIASTARDSKIFKLYAAPYVNYQLTSNFSLNLEYEVEAHHNSGDSGVDFTMYQTDIQPGVVWNITHKILLNPYIQVFTTNKASIDTMALGAVVSARLL